MIHIHIFRKHPRKLEIKSDGDISDGAFYRTSGELLIIVYAERRSVNEGSGGDFGKINRTFEQKKYIIIPMSFYIKSSNTEFP